MVQDYLIQNEAENNLPLGIINNLISGEYSNQDPYLAFVEEKGVPIIAVLCTPPFPVLFSYQNPPPADNILKLVLRDLMDFFGEEFAGVIERLY